MGTTRSRNRILISPALALLDLFARLLQELSVAGQGFAQGLKPLAQLLPIPRLLSDDGPQLLPQPFALLHCAGSQLFFLVLELLLVTFARLLHVLDSLLHRSGQGLA